MANVLIVAYLLIVLALIAVILLQRSEGGGLGMGGGGGGFMSVRGSANLLTRTTAILAALFFATAIGLTLLANLDRPNRSILERATPVEDATTAPTNVLDALNQLNGDAADEPDLALPVSPAPATTAPDLGTTAPTVPAVPDATPVEPLPAN